LVPRPRGIVHDHFRRIHKALRMSPAMASGATDELSSTSDIAALMGKAQAAAAKRGSHKERQAE